MSSVDARRHERVRYWVLIGWPAFLAACLLEGLVFALVDPGEIHWPGRFSEPTRQSVYTAAFFAFWLIATACSALVLWLADSSPRKRQPDAD